MDKIVRLFIDPSSISTGWALLKGTTILKTGTIVLTGPIRERLTALHWRYSHLFQGRTLIDLKETHIEQWGGRPHRYLIQSVGVLLAAIDYSTEIEQDIPVSSWQKYVGWPKFKGTKKEKAALKRDFIKNWEKHLDPEICHEVLLKQAAQVESLDELAAIGMGVYYTETKV